MAHDGAQLRALLERVRPIRRGSRVPREARQTLMNAYQIADEPAPSTFAKYAVNPLFPMLAMMFAGVWFAWPWFAFNSFAIGSPTRRAELAWLVAGLFVPAGVGIGLLMARQAGWLPGFSPAYVGLV